MNKENENILKDMIRCNYSDSEIRLYFLIKYQTEITSQEYAVIKKRVGQEDFRQNLITRYGYKCMITNSEIFEACHIEPYIETNNMSVDNGLLLNSQHHKMFDSYIWSINPETLEIEINDKKANPNDLFILLIRDKSLDQLRLYSDTLIYITKHYTKFKSYM